MSSEVPRPHALRRLWGRVQNLQYAYRRRRHSSRSAVEHIGDVELVISPGVFNPRLCYTGEFMAACIREAPPASREYVLDLGTGSGIGAIVAARCGAIVDAVDINPAAIECARANASLNRVEKRISLHHGDLFAPVQGRRFHRILFNPPFIRGVPRDPFDGAWRSEDIAERFAEGLSDHLTPDGVGWLILSSVGDVEGFVSALTDVGLDVTLVRTQDQGSEVLSLHEVRVH